MASNKTQKIFPIVSLSYLTSNYVTGSGTLEHFYVDPKVKLLSEEIVNAFSEWGFVYLVDHGISDPVVRGAFKSSKDFFTNDKIVKEKFIHEDKSVELGYVPYNVESFDKERPFDLKECFDFLPETVQTDMLKESVPDMAMALSNLFKYLMLLSQYFLRLLSIALKPNDVEFLSSNHRLIGDMNQNVSVLRSLWYPAVGNKSNILKNQLRCGEHSDYGTFTFLLQDEAGGLQVVSPSGEYVDATPIPGSIVVNAGDLLEIWSAGKYKSTRHRVLIPNNSDRARQSIVLFIHPDKSTFVSCLDGSDKYKPINAFDYVMKKFDETYG